MPPEISPGAIWTEAEGVNVFKEWTFGRECARLCVQGFQKDTSW